jgi:hypothetical protein
LTNESEYTHTSATTLQEPDPWPYHRHIRLGNAPTPTMPSGKNSVAQTTHRRSDAAGFLRYQLDDAAGLLNLALRLSGHEASPHDERCLRQPAFAQHLCVPEVQQVEHGRCVLAFAGQELIALLGWYEAPEL